MFADEGFGVEVVRRIQDMAVLPPEVEVIDGGTQGIYLLDIVESADRLLVYDAIIPKESEVKVYTYQKEELPAIVHRKMSAHQAGFSELLSLAQLHEKVPEEIVLIGIPPQKLDMQVGLSETIDQLVPEAIKKGQEIVKAWVKVAAE